MKSPIWILPGRRVQFQSAAVKAPIGIGALQELAHFASGSEGSWFTLIAYSECGVFPETMRQIENVVGTFSTMSLIILLVSPSIQGCSLR